MLVVVALGMTSAASAQIVSPFHIVPVVAKVAGQAGTDWMTTLSVSNLSDSAVQAQAMFFRENTAHSFPVGSYPTKMFTLSAGETLTVQDVLGEWFPGEGNTKGTLVVMATEAMSGDATAKFAVSARVFNNANPQATYGQTVPSSLVNMVLGAGKSVLPGAQQDGRARSNIGIVSFSAQPVQMLITVYDANGAQVAQATRTVQPFSLSQYSLSSFAVSTLSPPGRVEVQVDPSTITWDPCSGNPYDLFGGTLGLFTAYMSKVDEATGDAEFSFGQVDWEDYTDTCGEDPSECCPCD
jgi:hypothetical protein